MGTSPQGSISVVCQTLMPLLSELSSSFLSAKCAKLNSHIRHFTCEELKNATDNFSSDIFDRRSAHSRIYKAVLENNRLAAAKVLETSHRYPEGVFVREVEILNGLRHEKFVQLIGYFCCKKMYAIFYDLLISSLKQRLSQVKWSERIRLTIAVAKALECINSCYPPIVHKDVNLSNTLLSEDGKPEYIMYGKVD